jgi:hypothetical protein
VPVPMSLQRGGGGACENRVRTFAKIWSLVRCMDMKAAVSGGMNACDSGGIKACDDMRMTKSLAALTQCASSSS